MKEIALAWRVSKPWVRFAAIVMIVIIALSLIRLASGAAYRAMGWEQFFSPPPVVVRVQPTSASYSSSTTTPVDDDHMDAKMICQQFASQTLKAPSTAKFEPIRTVAAAPDKDSKLPNAWVSVGWVDSQNSYGAMIRSDYQCSVIKTGPDKWRLVEMYWHKERLDR